MLDPKEISENFGGAILDKNLANPNHDLSNVQTEEDFATGHYSRTPT
jgi:hypothetical protein